MADRPFDYDEAILFCSHNLDVSNTKNLATDIATRLGVNINITEAFEDEVIDTVQIPNATITKNLQGRDPKNSADLEYVLFHGDEGYYIFDNYLQYIFPISLDYLKLIEDLENEKRNDDPDDGFYELKKFGATEVHITIGDEIHLSSEDQKDWSTVVKVLTNEKSHYLQKVF